MSDVQYEVEIKCLVEDANKAIGLPAAIRSLGYTLEQTAQYEQLNDYYIDGNIEKLVKKLEKLLKATERKQLKDIAENNTTFSVRGRQNNDKVVFQLKATKGEDANHAAQRAEFEATLKVSLDELKDVIISAGFKIQARWEAYRTLYRVSNGITFDSLFSPGYGYMAEFELVVNEKDQLENAETRVRSFAHELGLEPVDPHRVERMFAYYNEHWQEYYGTKKTFHMD